MASWSEYGLANDKWFQDYGFAEDWSGMDALGQADWLEKAAGDYWTAMGAAKFNPFSQIQTKHNKLLAEAERLRQGYRDTQALEEAPGVAQAAAESLPDWYQQFITGQRQSPFGQEQVEADVAATQAEYAAKQEKDIRAWQSDMRRRGLETSTVGDRALTDLMSANTRAMNTQTAAIRSNYAQQQAQWQMHEDQLVANAIKDAMDFGLDYAELQREYDAAIKAGQNEWASFIAKMLGTWASGGFG